MFIGAALVVRADGRGVRAPRDFGLRRPPRGGSRSAWSSPSGSASTSLSAIVGRGRSAIDPEDELPEQLGVEESDAALVLVLVLVTVMAPIAEEFFFRGFFFRALRNWQGLWPAAILTGAVFGAIHLGSRRRGSLVPLAIFGFGLCLLYHWTRLAVPLHRAARAEQLGRVRRQPGLGRGRSR